MNEEQNSSDRSGVAIQAAGDRSRIIEEALAEIERELQVRERCFPRWIAEGRISKIDARDRLQRQKYAQEILQAALDTSTAADDITRAVQS